MTTIQHRLTKLCQDLLSDFERATTELAAADRHLKTIFKALYDAGFTEVTIQTGFMPAMHIRAITVYKATLRNLEEEQEHTPCRQTQNHSETSCPRAAPTSSDGKSPST